MLSDTCPQRKLRDHQTVIANSLCFAQNSGTLSSRTETFWKGQHAAATPAQSGCTSTERTCSGHQNNVGSRIQGCHAQRDAEHACDIGDTRHEIKFNTLNDTLHMRVAARCRKNKCLYVLALSNTLFKTAVLLDWTARVVAIVAATPAQSGCTPTVSLP